MIDAMAFLQVAAAAAEAGPGFFGGSFALGMAGMGAALGVALVGFKAVEALGRNPGAFGKILTLAILGMALAEAIAIYALLVTFITG